MKISWTKATGNMSDLIKPGSGLERLTANQLSFYECFTDIENEKTFRNATESYRASSYSSEGWTDAALRVAAHNTRHHPKIAPLIDARLREYYTMAKMSTDEVLARLSDLVRFDIGDILDVHDGGHVTVNVERAKELGMARFIKKITTLKNGTQTVEFHDPMQAQDKILRAAGAYKPSAQIGAENLMAAMMEAKKALEREDADAIDTDYEIVDE